MHGKAVLKALTHLFKTSHVQKSRFIVVTRLLIQVMYGKAALVF